MVELFRVFLYRNRRQLLHRQQHPPYRGLLRDYRILFTTVDRAVEEIRRFGVAVTTRRRGKVGRVYGDLMQLLTVMKGTPLAYNKDFQEDKESLFDAIDTWKATIDIFAKMLDKTEFRMDQIEKQLGKGFLNATDIAEHSVPGSTCYRRTYGKSM